MAVATTATVETNTPIRPRTSSQRRIIRGINNLRIKVTNSHHPTKGTSNLLRIIKATGPDPLIKATHQRTNNQPTSLHNSHSLTSARSRSTRTPYPRCQAGRMQRREKCSRSMPGKTWRWEPWGLHRRKEFPCCPPPPPPPRRLRHQLATPRRAHIPWIIHTTTTNNNNNPTPTTERVSDHKAARLTARRANRNGAPRHTRTATNHPNPHTRPILLPRPPAPAMHRHQHTSNRRWARYTIQHHRRRSSSSRHRVPCWQDGNRCRTRGEMYEKCYTSCLFHGFFHTLPALISYILCYYLYSPILFLFSVFTIYPPIVPTKMTVIVFDIYLQNPITRPIIKKEQNERT